MIRIAAVLLWVGAWGHTLAQDSASVRQLPVVTVRGISAERFMAGLKIQRIDSALTAVYRFQTLADLLAIQTPMQFKSYGPGQLATVGFRGTSASHTAVLWNGININSPTLGLIDFSTLPIAGFDQVSVQYGAAASAVGSDAVGGSVLLRSLPETRPGLTAMLGHRFSPYGGGQTQAGVRFAQPLSGGRLLSGKTSLYTGTSRFAPPYRDRDGYPIEPSETAQKGLAQDLFFQTATRNQLALNLWVSDNRATTSPADSVGRETTRTQAYRVLTSYELGESRPGRWFSGRTLLRAGFIRDRLDYGKGRTFETDPSRAQTDRLLLRVERELTQALGAAAHPLTIRAGAEWVHYTARVDGYAAGLLQEQRADLYALIRYQPIARLTVAVNLRQAFVTRFDPPLTPSLGLDYRLIDRAGWQLTGRGSLARSYRVPTLNERYWATLGNPDIRPERGFSQEAGLDLSRNGAGGRASLSVTAFRNHVYDWTYWNPARGYRVENLQEVLARGLEVQGQLTRRAGTWQWGGFGQYAYNRSMQLRVYDPSATDVVGKQLIYLPLHTASASAFMQRGLHRLTLTWQGVGQRPYTFDNSQYLPEYQLVNLIAETQIRLGNYQGRAMVQVDNLFDELYLNVKNNAMPGRSVALTLILSAQSKSTTP